MPANRPGRNRDEKRADVLAVARKLFVEDGFDATSMSALARAAGVAGNTIYWYFADKDDVLVAVLDAVLGDALAEYETISTAPLEDQLLWIVGTLRQLHRLVSTVHSRAAQAPAVDEWHSSFHLMAETMFGTALAETGPAHLDVDAEVKVVVFTVEGMLSHGLADADVRAICRTLAQRWSSVP